MTASPAGHQIRRRPAAPAWPAVPVAVLAWPLGLLPVAPVALLPMLPMLPLAVPEAGSVPAVASAVASVLLPLVLGLAVEPLP